YSLAYGARFLKRVIESKIKLPISQRWTEGTGFVADAIDGRIEISVVSVEGGYSELAATAWSPLERLLRRLGRQRVLIGLRDFDVPEPFLHVVAFLHGVDQSADGVDVLLAGVRARIQALVARDHVRKGAGEEAHEVVLRSALQVHHVGADERRIVIGDGLDRRFELPRLRREAGNDRRHQDACLHAGVAKRPDRAQALHRVRRAGLERAPRLFVHRRYADAHGAAGDTRQLGEEVGVAHDHRALRHDADGRPARDERLDRSTRQLVVALDRLIRIGRGPERDLLARPRRLVELTPQHV